jgi:myosin protein heavy chain
MRKPTDVVKGIEGENDFSGRKYVWLKDPQTAFVKGWVVEELEGNKLLVQCDDGSVSVRWEYSVSQLTDSETATGS